MRISWIEPNRLAASGIPLHAKDIKSLHEQGIRAIITLTEPPLTNQKEITSELASNLDIELFHLPIVDQHPPDELIVIDELKSIIDSMLSKSKPILLHCHAGIGRTGTMLHAYYLASGMSLDDTKTKIKLARQMSQFFMMSDKQQEFIQQLAVMKAKIDLQSSHQERIHTIGIDHICLLVSNLEVAKAYYRSLFDVITNPHPTASNTLMCETEHIHFFIEEVDFPKELLSKQHLSLRVSDVQTIMDTLQSLNIPFESGKFEGFEYQNYDWVEWRDPDGIRLECVELI